MSQLHQSTTSRLWLGGLAARARGDVLEGSALMAEAARVHLAVAKSSELFSSIDHRAQAIALYIEVGDVPKASQLLAELRELEQDPPDEVSRRRLHRVIGELDDRLRPVALRFDKLFAKLHRQRQSSGLREMDLTRAISAFPGFAGFRFFLARVHQKKGNLRREFELLKEAARLDPEYPGFAALLMYLAPTVVPPREAEQIIRDLYKRWSHSAHVAIGFACGMLQLSRDMDDQARRPYLFEVFGAAVTARENHNHELPAHMQAYAALIAAYTEALIKGVEPSEAMLYRTLRDPLIARGFPSPTKHLDFERELVRRANPIEAVPDQLAA
jgi:tetratricopeptide (TPR) repeat protein